VNFLSSLQDQVLACWLETVSDNPDEPSTVIHESRKALDAAWVFHHEPPVRRSPAPYKDDIDASDEEGTVRTDVDEDDDEDVPVHQLLQMHKKRRRNSDARFTTRVAPPALRSRDEAGPSGTSSLDLAREAIRRQNSESRSTDHSLTIIRPVPRPWSPSIPRAHNEMAGRNPMKPPAAGQSSRTKLSTKRIPNYITYPTPLSHSLSPRRAMYPPSRANRDLNFPNLAHRSSSSAERSDALPSVERAPSRGPGPGSGWGRIAGSRNGTPVWSSTDD
jgi:hypothetical protein